MVRDAFVKQTHTSSCPHGASILWQETSLLHPLETRFSHEEPAKILLPPWPSWRNGWLSGHGVVGYQSLHSLCCNWQWTWYSSSFLDCAFPEGKGHQTSFLSQHPSQHLGGHWKTPLLLSGQENLSCVLSTLTFSGSFIHSLQSFIYSLTPFIHSFILHIIIYSLTPIIHSFCI